MQSATAAVDDVSLVDRIRSAQLPTKAERRRRRLAARASLRDFADELARRGCAVTPMTVLRWEQGRTTPRLEQAAVYRQLLDDVDAALQ